MSNNFTNNSNISRNVNKEEIFSILANEWCRHVLRYFHDSAKTTASVNDLITYAGEYSATVRTDERAAIALHHTALPKLANGGIVEYDGCKTIRYQGHPFLEDLLRFLDEFEDGS